MRAIHLSEEEKEILRKAAALVGKTYGAEGGRRSKRRITPEQQRKMQEARRRRSHMNFPQAPVREGVEP